MLKPNPELRFYPRRSLAPSGRARARAAGAWAPRGGTRGPAGPALGCPPRPGPRVPRAGEETRAEELGGRRATSRTLTRRLGGSPASSWGSLVSAGQRQPGRRLPGSLLPRGRERPSPSADTRPLSSRLDQAGAAFGTGHTFLKRQTQTRSVSGVERRDAFGEKPTGVATRDGQTSSEKNGPCPHPPPLRAIFSCFLSELSDGSKTIFFFPSCCFFF